MRIARAVRFGKAKVDREVGEKTTGSGETQPAYRLFAFFPFAFFFPLAVLFSGAAFFGEVCFAALGGSGTFATSGLTAGCGKGDTGAPLLFFLPIAGATTAAGWAAPAAALAARPRLGGGGGGGGGGGASGFRNFKISVRECSFPSSKSMNTS